MQNQSFQLLVDGAPYEIKAVPFSFNEGTRYRVTYNGSPEYIFAYDDNAGQYLAIDNDSIEIPANVETEIAKQLNRMSA